MAKSLIEARKKWEGYAKSRSGFVGHFVIVDCEAAATVLRKVGNDGEFEYDFLRYFRIGDGWEVSVDRSQISADEMIRHLIEYCE